MGSPERRKPETLDLIPSPVALSKSCKEMNKEKTWKDTEPRREASHARRYG
jgi:hypothetical protein